MGTGEFSLLQSGVWLILLVPVVTILGVVLLVRYWQKKTQEDLKTMRGELRRLQGGFRQLSAAVSAYSPEDPEPFGSRVAAVLTQLEQIANKLGECETEYVSIQDQMHWLTSNTWQATVGAPYYWYLVRQQVSSLIDKLAEVQATLAAASEAELAITHLGWELAEQARYLYQVHERFRKLLLQMQERNMHGEALVRAARQEAASRKAMASIPPVFLNGEEDAVLQGAGREDIVHTYNLLISHREPLGEMLTQVETWDQQYNEAAERIRALRKALDKLSSVLKDTPSGLNLEALKGKFDQMEVIAQNLEATLHRMEAESLEQVIQEAGRVYEAAGELEERIKKGRQHVAALGSLLQELTEGVKVLSGQFAALGTNTVHPVLWEASTGQLSQISRHAAALGPANRARTPEQAAEDFEKAARLREQRQQLARHFDKVSQQHSELLQLLSGPEVSGAVEWSQRARKIIERAEEYAPENWPRTAETVSALPGELHTLQEQLQRLVINRKGEPIPEAEVGRRLADTQAMVRLLEGLRGRVEVVQTRLEEIQSIERQAREQLETSLTALNQVSLLARSNDFLREVSEAELGKLYGSLQALAGSIDDRQQGSVEKKAKAISSLIAKVETAGNSWVEKLNKDIEAEARTLSASLAALDAIATLDEPAVAEAQRLLAGSQSFRSGGLGHRQRFSLDQLVLELKRRSDFWQESAAAIHALDDVEQHVVDTYQMANEHRQYANDTMAELTKWMRANRKWPPTTQSLESEQEELERIEAQWAALKSEPRKAISLVAQLGNLAAMYHAMAERARQTAERAADEQERVANLEGQIQELAQLWHGQGQAYRENVYTAQEIQKLLGEIQQEVEGIRRQYGQGEKNYDQVVQALQLLLRRVRMAQVMVDDNHVIDVNGRLIAYR